jgi:hypothetical protein
MKTGRRAAAAAHWKRSLDLDPTQQQVKAQLQEMNIQ